jgi:hypothetical protein
MEHGMSKAKVMRALRFLRLVDDQNNISLTNIALILVLAHLLRQPTVSLQDLLTFCGAMIGYQVKRFASGTVVTPEQEADDLRKEIESLKTAVTALGFSKTVPRR